MKDPVAHLAAVALSFAAASFFPPAAAAEPAPVVVELFTSQGCNSCPPADALLGDLAKRDDVLPLSFHVTYWDRLGWPDTFGLEDSTRRQERYAGWFGSSRVYTPQMVVGGRIDVVGSNKNRVLKAIDLVGAHVGPGPAIAFDDEGVTVGEGDAEPATVWLVAYDAAHDVPISRGENAGRTLRYHHVVRALEALGAWRGTAERFDLPLERLAANGHDGAAILVQRERDGAILSAARIGLAPG